MDLEATPIEENTNAVDAIASLMSEEQEPESTAIDNELEETTLSENDPEPTGEGEEVAAAIEALNLSDFDQDQLLQFGDDTVSLADLQEIYSNRTASSVLDGRRSELDALQKQLDERNNQFSFLDNYNRPELFLHAVLSDMYDKEMMPAEVANAMMQVLHDANDKGTVSYKGWEEKAAYAAREAEIAKREEEAQRNIRIAEYKAELAQLQSKYGGISEELQKEAGELIESEYNRSGELMSLTAAFEVLDGKGKFNKAPKTRAKLADSLRRSGTVVEQKAGNDLSAESALKNLLK